MPAAASRIRWDRVSRVMLLALLVGVLALYVGPARAYWSTWHEAKDRRAEVAALKSQNERLRARKADLRSARVLEREARRIGMVRQGERAYVIRGLPK